MPLQLLYTLADVVMPPEVIFEDLFDLEIIRNLLLISVCASVFFAIAASVAIIVIMNKYKKK